MQGLPGRCRTVSRQKRVPSQYRSASNMVVSQWVATSSKAHRAWRGAAPRTPVRHVAPACSSAAPRRAAHELPLPPTVPTDKHRPGRRERRSSLRLRGRGRLRLHRGIRLRPDGCAVAVHRPAAERDELELGLGLGLLLVVYPVSVSRRWSRAGRFSTTAPPKRGRSPVPRVYQGVPS
jgi:hypothetical protein